MVKSDGTIFRDIGVSGDFAVLVDLAINTAEMAYYLMPTAILNIWLHTDFTEWVAAPGLRGRPHNPENKKRNLSLPKYAERLQPYLNARETIWEETL